METTRLDAPSVLDHPVGPLTDRRLERLGAAEVGPARTPLTLLFVAYTSLALAITGIGVLLVHASFLEPMREWDLSVSEWFVEHRTPTWDTVLTAASTGADSLGIIGVAVLACVFLGFRHRWRDVLLIAGGLGLEAAVFITANALVRRERPPVLTVGEAPTTFSFPSGHIAATIVLYGCLALLVAASVRSRALQALVWLVPVVFATAVGLSRVYRGMHFTTDVVMGALLGMTCLWVAVVAARASAVAEGREDRS